MHDAEKSEDEMQFWAKRLAQKLANPMFPFVMILEDFIFGWKGM